jgi:hypothetical protein|tara:strand:+ start:119 stop:523 length:405 start_codon:yes stop_codon:yes gene_type:complete
MNIWTKFFGKEGIEVADKVSNMVDRFVHTSDEKVAFKKEMNSLFNQAAANEQENITKRWESDMMSDNKLSKSVRPCVLIFLIVSTIVLIFIDSSFITFAVHDEWKDLLKVLLITVVAAYFGGRSYEKGKKINNG